MSQPVPHEHQAVPIPTGALALVVGPSGAGKDTLMNAARMALAGDDRFVFARRIITRASHDTSESHDVISVEAFDRAEAAHDFLLSWRAHGLGYAIPGTAASALRASKVVVANVSRASIGAAERLVERVAVLHVTAPIAVLAQRIAARGREPEETIAQRLARQAPLTAVRAPIIEIMNAGSLDDAVRPFRVALRTLAEQAAGNG
jgi:phosphonate metabolism protein PhnN/1,5-bisphosphokinase (PRPP-forming)